jgi:hypothetical protein
VQPDIPLDLDALAAALAPKIAKHLHGDVGKLIDLDELAGRIGVSRRGAGGLVARGELPPGFLIGGVRRWDWPDVLKHLSARQGRCRRRGRGRYDRQAQEGGGR